MFGFEIFFMAVLTCALLEKLSQGYIFPSLFVIVAHGYCCFCMINLLSLKLAISEGKAPAPSPTTAVCQDSDSSISFLLPSLPIYH